jgi:hypothetical protein
MFDASQEYQAAAEKGSNRRLELEASGRFCAVRFPVAGSNSS